MHRQKQNFRLLHFFPAVLKGGLGSSFKTCWRGYFMLQLHQVEMPFNINARMVHLLVDLLHFEWAGSTSLLMLSIRPEQSYRKKKSPPLSHQW